jgi:predicted nucleic acid-binding protein
MYLIDTSAWILVLRKGGPKNIQQKIPQWLEDNQVVTSGIIRVELFQGCRNEDELNKLRDGMSGLSSISLTEENYTELAIIGFKLRRGGIRVPVPDLIIAMQSRISNSILVHADAHYERIKEMFEIETLPVT